jgi:hypothetical protein
LISWGQNPQHLDIAASAERAVSPDPGGGPDPWHPTESARTHHPPEITMTDETRALLAEIEADRRETEMVLAEIDAALEAYGRSIERGLALAAEMRDMAAMLEEWFV